MVRMVDMAVLALAPGPGLLFGLMLLAAIVGGYLAHLLHAPRVIGYLFGGIALHAGLAALLPEADEKSLQEAAVPLVAIQDLALGIILFAVGSVFERSHLKIVGKRVLKISACEIALVVVLVFAGCLLVTLLTQSDQGLRGNFALALLLALAGVATAPAATLFVLREYDAKGPNTDTILTLTGLNNVACILLFYLTFMALAALDLIETRAGIGASPGLDLLVTTAGSLALGFVCGAALSVAHAKLGLAEILLLFFALMIVLGAGEKWLLERAGVSYNFLLTALVVGAIFANVALEPQRLEGALRTVAAPIFAGFFVLAGYHLHVRELLDLGWLGGVYLVARGVGKIVGCRLGRRWARDEEQLTPHLGAALLCQAAVVIGLSVFVTRTWVSPLAAKFATVLMGSIVVFEFIGPLLIKHCVKQAGEVKVLTLLRRVDTGREQLSAGRLTLQALGRLFGLGAKQQAHDPEKMQVKHIMRSSVQFIRASDTLDDVLHFIERSTHHHFPVADEGGKYAGMIHFGDVREMIYDPLVRDLVTAVDLADTAAPTVVPEMTLLDLLQVFEECNVGTLPVVDGSTSRRIVGVVEQRDLLRVLHRSTTEPRGV